MKSFHCSSAIPLWRKIILRPSAGKGSRARKPAIDS